MDDCSRQDPAYRPATEGPRSGGALLFARAASRPVARPLTPLARGGTVPEPHSTLSNGNRREETGVEHSLPQRALAETLGTALLVLVGPGSVVATLILAGKSVPAITGADLLGISFAFGLVITALVYAIGKVSGCHINPAVTFALAATKRFPWREVPAYMAGQFVGAVIGAFAIWALFAHTGIDLGMGQTSFN